MNITKDRKGMMKYEGGTPVAVGGFRRYHAGITHTPHGGLLVQEGMLASGCNDVRAPLFKRRAEHAHHVLRDEHVTHKHSAIGWSSICYPRTHGTIKQPVLQQFASRVWAHAILAWRTW